jgi:hypothetical protein
MLATSFPMIDFEDNFGITLGHYRLDWTDPKSETRAIATLRRREIAARIRISLFVRHTNCRRFCDGQSLRVQREPTPFNKERATGSISINYEL